ncbi:hypothetical protein [Candidatus Electronema sp. PJ]
MNRADASVDYSLFLLQNSDLNHVYGSLAKEFGLAGKELYSRSEEL